MKRSREALRAVPVAAPRPDGSVLMLQFLAAATLLALALAAVGALR